MIRGRATLKLSNGSSFEGDLIGAPLRTSGELVFSTGMVGYSEAISDPSYYGQILIFTYPLIGNYGIPTHEAREGMIPRGFESPRARTSAVILSTDSPEAFHWNSFQSLDRWLEKEGVPGIAGLDTRHLVHLIREEHGLCGQILPDAATGNTDMDGLFPFTEDGFFNPSDHEIIGKVSTPRRLSLGNGSSTIGLIDCGVKWNIIRQLVDAGCRVELLPWDADFNQVTCDGWLISNGPGDPSRTGTLTGRVRELLSGDKPVLGICLGHQILAMAAGAKAEKMPYGHRSHNQPVYQVGTRKGCITSQNHGFVIVESGLPEDWSVWFRNVNDDSVEGIRHKSKPFRSVQFHPEAAGGPRDSAWILQDFVEEVRQHAHPR